jgi:hypothetical protein
LNWSALRRIAVVIEFGDRPLTKEWRIGIVHKVSTRGTT